MNSYTPQTQDIMFILEDVLHASQQISEMQVFKDVDSDLLNQVLEEASKFVKNQIAPLNQIGDEQGAQLKDGVVTMPPGFKVAYESFWQSGWASLSTAEQDGGQSLPVVLDSVLYEWLSAANHGWTMAPGLLHGAYECIKNYASQELKDIYLSKVGTGEWLATMCLTEPHAGSDLGLVSTRATPFLDSQYLIRGTKIFISGGEHDLTENIIHLVLARLPDAPPGPKGLSLFLVPKYYPDSTKSKVYCERIEEKMGIHASPTCVLRFDDAKGYLIGEEGRGLNAMFVMMNAARLHVALQGVGLLDASWQKANAYARERTQMRAPKLVGEKSASADLIIEHPAIKRKLDTQRAWIDGSRVLAYQTGLYLDIAKYHPNSARCEFAKVWCSLITPVLKATCTEQGFNGASECLQVFGGHGYIREWGIEQNVRDARIAMIYEGTNEIQAIDLLMRKVLGDRGLGLSTIIDELSLSLNNSIPNQQIVLSMFEKLQEISKAAIQVNELKGGAVTLSWISGDYLRLTAIAFLSWAWSRIEATTHLNTERWGGGAKALKAWVQPEFNMRYNIIKEQFEIL